MSSIPQAIIQSVVLKPGEVFTLPPGAKLLSATDPSTLDASCEGLLDNLETLQCYAFIIAVGDHDNSDTIIWDSKAFTVRGWRYDGKDFNDVAIGTTGAAGALPADMNKTLLNSAQKNGLFVSDVVFGYTSGDGDNGTHNYIVLKTLPSVASKLEIKVDTGSSFIAGDTYVPAAYIKPVSYSSVSALPGMPGCSDSSSSSLS